MSVKDGGAMMGVDQATDSGAELSRLIMELILLIFQQIRDANDESDTRAELMREMEDIKNQLDMIYHINKLTVNFEHLEERILTPAEKVYGVQGSFEKKALNTKPSLDRTNERSPF